MSLRPIVDPRDTTARDAEAGLRRGQMPAAVIESLVHAGVEREAATRIVHRTGLDRARGRLPSQRAGRTDILVGASVVGIGMLIAAASSWLALHGGGSYVVGSGTLAYGMFRFFRGLVRTI